MNARTDNYRPMVSCETILEMAQEKVLEDEEAFSEWLCAETMSPTERRPSVYFSLISTSALLKQVLMKQKASQEQLAQAWLEVRRRYLEDNEDRVSGEYARLMAQEG
jgi:hypothetical protein